MSPIALQIGPQHGTATRPDANPAASVRGPTARGQGETPVLEPVEARVLLNSANITSGAVTPKRE